MCRYSVSVLAVLSYCLGFTSFRQLTAAVPPDVNLASVRQTHDPKPAPIRIRGVITGFSGWKNSFFLQNATGAISVDRLENTAARPGDEVEVDGELRAGLFAPVLLSTQTRVIAHHELPLAYKATYSQLASGAFDSRLVEVTGVVQALHQGEIWGRHILFLDLHTPEGPITVHVLNYPRPDPPELVDSIIRIKGVCGTIFNDQQQLVGLRLFVSDLTQAEVVKRGVDTTHLPLTKLSELKLFGGPDLEHRVKISGTVTYQETSNTFYLQDGKMAARIEALKPGVWPPGQRVSASGFVATAAHALTLRGAAVERLGAGLPVQPVVISATAAIQTKDGFTQALYNGQLVQIDGRILELLPNSTNQIWAVRSGKIQFEAQLSNTAGSKGLVLEAGSEVRLTGICVADEDENQNPKSFRILLRSSQDAQALNAPYWSSSLLLLLAILLLILLGSLGLWFFHRRGKNASQNEIEDKDSAWRKVRLRQASRLLALLSAAIGGLVAIGWIFDIHFLQTGDARFAMMPNAALSILMAGIAVSLSSGKSRRPNPIGVLAGAYFSATIGALTLLEYVTSWNLRIDGLLIRNPQAVSGFLYPGRIALATALCLLLAGCAIGFLLKKPWAGMGQVLAIAVGVISLLNLISHLYGNRARYGSGAHATMAVPTAAVLVCLSLAVLFLRPEWGLMRTVSLSESGGVLARRMIPIAITLPILLGWIRLQGQVMGLYDTRFGLSLFTLSNIVCFGFVIWNSAFALNRMDEARSRAERDLKERDARLEMVFETGMVGDWTWDAVKDKLIGHPVVWKIYGKPGHTGSEPSSWFRQRQHPGDAEKIASAMRAAVAHGKLDVEFRVVRPDGTVRWVGCRGTTICNDSGELLQVNGINFDITDRKLAELKLRDSEERFRQLADAMPQIVWISKVDRTIEYYNRRWFEYTGCSPETPWAETMHPDDLEHCRAVLKKAMAEGSPYAMEIRIKRAGDLSYRWHLARAIPAKNADGGIERWFGTFTDIEDFKHASAEVYSLNQTLEARVRERSAQLAESEQRYRALVEGVKDYAILMLDEAGNVSSWNSGAEQILGYTAHEILGKHFSVFSKEETRRAGHLDDELSIARQTGRFEDEGWRVNKNGTTFWANVVVTPLWNQDGTLRGFSKVTRDISDRKRAEELVKSQNAQLAEANRELIKQTRRAEEGSRAKSDFLAAMSHEIRTPMNAILGMADLLWETELNSSQKEYVGRFRRAGSSLLALINDILDLSKIESGRFELEAIDFDLCNVVERTAELMVTRARMKNVELSAHVLPDVPQMMIGDPGRLQQILNNLLSNAVKFTERGSITLNVQNHSDNLPGHIQFIVEDTGIGIPVDKTAVIFEDFNQAESSTTRRFGGTGLGLGICRRLVDRMGGKLTVESRLGKGSTFVFDVVLPVSKTVAKAPAKEAAEFQGRRVLIVDDNSTNRLILREMCSGWGMVPAETDSALQARELLREARAKRKAFSLVLLDCIMPGIGGMDALSLLRKIDAEVPIILVSSDNRPGDVTKSKALGATAYLMKPVRSTELLAVITATLHFQAGIVSGSGMEAEKAMQILIADDSEDNRFLLAAYLGNRPYEITFAENGREAVEIFANQKFDLVLMDVQMPLMDGLAATASIRHLERERSDKPTPIVALTANALVEDIERSILAGCNAHLSKPISKAKLIAAIEGFQARPRT